MRCFDFAHQLVGFLLRHLAATDHVLKQIARTLENEAGESGGGADHVLHGGGHFASRLEADLVRLGRHLGDRIFYVGTAVTGAALWRNRRGHRCADGWGGGRCCSCSNCWLFSIGHLWAPVSAKGWADASENHRSRAEPKMGSNGAK